MLSTTPRNLALFALALGGFAIGTTEFVSMGLLPQVAENLIPTFQADPHAGIAHAGWMITAYAMGVVVGAPTLAVLTARMSQRKLVLILLSALMVGYYAGGLSPSLDMDQVVTILAGPPA